MAKMLMNGLPSTVRHVGVLPLSVCVSLFSRLRSQRSHGSFMKWDSCRIFFYFLFVADWLLLCSLYFLSLHLSDNTFKILQYLYSCYCYIAYSCDKECSLYLSLFSLSRWYTPPPCFLVVSPTKIETFFNEIM